METSETVTLNTQSLRYLNETRKWTLFFSILGFVGIGFLLLAALFIGTLLSSLPNYSETEAITAGLTSGFISVIYILIAILYFFPIYYLYKFSSSMRAGIQHRSSELVEEAFRYQKSHYKFLGIMTGILLIFYALIFIGTIAATAFF